MRYLLDTNACIRYLNGESQILRQRLQEVDLEDIVVCSIVKMELFYGAMRSENPDLSWRQQQRFLQVFVSLPFDDIAALFAGRIRAQLAAYGTPIGANDLLIASIALAHDLTLVTHNIGEFNRIEELHIEDWEAL
ncbi:ribonuclease VapC [Dulcicalothrix desertica PCC 7102]|uniref:Ribonuclease VapC n=1 Tax=Dulcicalothrix desertica PCC 7102 TaxID=232991 RepID=A0A3S1AL10_9CYAN|nr:type II toxin-antitoxin system VapC family toxin [Dulcicalothrix desertica]RUT03243.1 ribonuclease VapC [Dulcicalothrix desertica PCC 7102]TWH53614.1 tRNA(fMet)-specific endonuclease VapC [Dulcicalothrix desertica PCC 7102]